MSNTWREEDIKGQEQPWGYNFTCHSSKCGYTEYNQGKTALLILEGERELLHGPNAGKREQAHLWLSVGDQFKPSADGTRIEHKKGDLNARMDPNSKAQKFITSWFDNGGGAVLQEKGTDSLDAGMFAGLSFEVNEEKTSFTIDKEKREGRQPLFVRLLGQIGGATPSSGATSANGDVAPTEAITELARTMKASGNDDVDFYEKAASEFGVPLDAPVLAQAWSSA